MKRLKTVIFRPQDSGAASAAAVADNAKAARLELDVRRKEAADLLVWALPILLHVESIFAR
eukprot:4299535-Pleurochrysis_carterae.AAC.1